MGTHSFVVGEVAIAQNCEHQELNGCEVEVTKPLKLRKFRDVGMAKAYGIKIAGYNHITAAFPHQLKKLPDGREKISWETMKGLWQPREEVRGATAD